MQKIVANGIELAYSQTGRGSDLVFVHGIPTDYRAWDAQVPLFSENYDVITFSRRHARPNNNQGSLLESTIENNAADLEDMLKQITSPPVHLVGHSYGGFISAYLAANHPELIKKLVLIEPGISTMLIQDPKSRAQMLSLLFRSPSVALAAGTYLRRYYNPMLAAYHKSDLETSLRLFLDGLMNTDKALEKLPENVQKMTRDNASTIGEVEAKVPDFGKKDAKRISAPTLLVNGANGTKIFGAINKKLAESIPTNRLARIPDSSHFPHFENPEAFNKTLLEFLRQ